MRLLGGRLSGAAVEEDVLALDIAMENWLWSARVQRERKRERERERERVRKLKKREAKGKKKGTHAALCK